MSCEPSFPRRHQVAPVRPGAARPSASETDFEGFVGQSPLMHDVYNRIRAAAKSPAPVFITGETGTGKDIAARALHRLGPRSNRAFVRLNCAALPAELMESTLFGHRRGAFTGALADQVGLLHRAEGGTLFLDEISEMPLHLQAKLLHVVEDGFYTPVGDGTPCQANIRIISASNRPLLEARQKGFLREDLYHRLAVLSLALPRLQQRGRDDILRVARHGLSLIAAEEGRAEITLSPQAEDWLAAADWPGNIRQMLGLLRQAVVFSRQAVLSPEDFDKSATSLPEIATHDHSLALAEQRHIEKIIATENGNLSAAARVLGINPSTLHRKRQRWNKSTDT